MTDSDFREGYGQHNDMLYARNSQINAVVPYEVAGLIGLSVQVIFGSRISKSFEVPLTSRAREQQ